MTLLDVILIVLLAGFVWYGFFFGFFKALGGLIGVLVATLVAGWLFVPIGNILSPLFMGNIQAAQMVIFIVIFIVVTRLVGFVFYLLDRTFNFLKYVPFLKSINSILGGIVGFVEGAFLLGGIIYISERFSPWEFINEAIAVSSVAKYLTYVFDWISWLLPQAVQQIQVYV